MDTEGAKEETQMSMGHTATFAAAALLASTTALAQTTAPAPTTTSSKATAQKSESPATPVTLIGCVQKESDYRKEHDIKRGGGLNMGIGAGDEYVLINATRVEPGAAPAASADCTTASSGEAFEITGPREEQFKAFVGKRVEVSGTQKKAKVTASGQPTGGTDPMHGDLDLFEVEVSSVKEAAVAAAQVQSSQPQVETPAPATTAPTPAPAPAPAPPPPPAPTGTTGTAPTEALPHTASPLALYELASLLFLGGAYGVRRLRMK
jgi:hypothetical protein